MMAANISYNLSRPYKLGKDRDDLVTMDTDSGQVIVSSFGFLLSIIIYAHPQSLDFTIN